MDMIGLLNNAESFLPPEPLNLQVLLCLFGWLLAKSDGWLSLLWSTRTSIPSICRGILQNVSCLRSRGKRERSDEMKAERDRLVHGSR